MVERRGLLASLFGLLGLSFGRPGAPTSGQQLDGLAIIYYPPGATQVVRKDGTDAWENNIDLAAGIAKQLQPGSTVVVPSVFDECGERLWDVKVIGKPNQVKVVGSNPVVEARHVMAKHLKDDAPGGLRDAYRSSIAMLLHDHYGIKDYETRNRAADDVLRLIFGS